MKTKRENERKREREGQSVREINEGQREIQAGKRTIQRYQLLW
jgi:hypothetical protein